MGKMADPISKHGAQSGGYKAGSSEIYESEVRGLAI
jgi:hypothetical protein